MAAEYLGLRHFGIPGSMLCIVPEWRLDSAVTTGVAALARLATTATKLTRRNNYSSFSLTRYLPLCSSRCLPTFSM
jgi:hypothetical protein